MSFAVEIFVVIIAMFNMSDDCHFSYLKMIFFFPVDDDDDDDILNFLNLLFSFTIYIIYTFLLTFVIACVVTLLDEKFPFSH